MLNPIDFLKNCQIQVWAGTYAVLQTDTIPKEFVALIKDQNEMTAIIDERQLSKTTYIKAERDWKMLTFDAVLPFELVGFLAAVSKVLAEANISIFALSAYSTDHIMVKADMLQATKAVLSDLGCQFNQESAHSAR